MQDSQQAETLAQTRRLLIDELERSAAYHEAGQYEELGATFDQIDELIWSVKPKRVRNQSLEYLAYCLLDVWIDSSNHDWLHYGSVDKNHWPVLARRMKEVLKGRRDFRIGEYKGILP